MSNLQMESARQASSAWGRATLRLARETGFVLDVDVAIPTSGIVVLFGPSGCGKTTLLRCVAGLERGQGSVRIGEQLWQDDTAGLFVPTYERNLGYVFQEASLFTHLNVEKNLTFGLERARVPGGRERLKEAVELLGIGHLLKRRVSELSGGERQRCAIARALTLQPDVLLMDEPLAALDWARRREILPWLEKLRDELQIPVLYVTHSADEMARLADELVVMEAGRVLAAGSLSDVLADVRMPVRTEYGEAAVLDGVVEDISPQWRTAMVKTGAWRFEVAAASLARGSRIRIRILARDVSISIDHPGETSIRNILPARIAAVEELEDGAESAYAIVKLEHDGEWLLSRLLRRSAADLKLTPGMQVWAQVKAAAVVI